MYVIRVETPLLWVEYDEQDETLAKGDAFVVATSHATFEVESVIQLQSDGVILTLRPVSPSQPWPRERDRVSFVKIRRG